MAGEPGGDRGDGTVLVVRCPWDNLVMHSADELESHYKMHEARGEEKKYTN